MTSACWRVEFERRDTLYLLRDERGEVLSFFMVSWDTLEIDGRQVPTLNAGLTAARPDQKGTGKSIRLYRHVVSEAQERERLQRRKLIVWGTLASPIAYRIAGKVFADWQPALDGTYSDDSEQVARAVRRKLGIAERPGRIRSSSPAWSPASASPRRSGEGSPTCAGRSPSPCSTGLGSTRPGGIDCSSSPRSRPRRTASSVRRPGPRRAGSRPSRGIFVRPVTEGDAHEQSERGAVQAMVRGSLEPAPIVGDR